ncbi:MAG: hypothetical protein ACRYFX_05795 [Janthinobacterium lividum]
MAADKEQREIEILLNAQQANASIKDMAAGVALMNNQLSKMGQDDPRRAQLQRDFQLLTQRVGAARAEMRTYVQTEEELQAATEKLNKENQQVILNGQKLNSSFRDMKDSAALLEKQLHELSGDDPGRKKMLADYHALQERIAGVTTEMKGATEGTGFFKQGMATAFGFLLSGGIMGLAQQLFGFFAASREEYLSSAKSAADLEATLVATKNAAGLTADEIRAIGTERAKYTLFDDDETNRASAMLLTFKNVKKGVFEEAIPAIQDLATKMAGDGPADLKGASIQLGKALNDPIVGVTKLTKVGVTFTEQQKEQIAAMVKAGDTAGAQRVILGELNSEFGGSAEAARKAGGGMATLTMRFNEFKETVGGKVSGVLDSLSQWLGRVLDKAQPLLDMVSALGDEFADYYHEISDIVESLGLFNSKTDTAKLVVEGLKYALTVLLIPLKVGLQVSKALVDAFIDWYNKSELLRGVLGGLGAVVVQLFTTIKDDALKILGGVGDIIVGIFTLDKAKIVAGFKSALAATADVMLEEGNKAAEAFQKGYEANKNNHITRTVRVDTEETTTSSGGTAASSGEEETGESAKAKKAREAKEKREAADAARQAKAKEEAEKKLQLELYNTAQAAYNQNATLREKELADIEYDALRKINTLTGSEQQIQAAKLLIEQETEDKKRALQAKFDEQDKQDQQKKLDEAIKFNDAATEEELAQLALFLAQKALTQQEYEEEVYQTKKFALDRELALVKQHYGQESAEYKKLNAEKLKDEAAHTTKQKAIDADLAKFKKGVSKVEEVLNSDNVKFLEESLGKQTVLYKAFQVARKLAAAAKIEVDLVEEIQGYWASSSGFGPAGVIWAGIQSGVAVVRAGVAMSQLGGFAKGGATGDGIAMQRPSGSRTLSAMGTAMGLGVGTNGKLVDAQGLEVAGLVHKNEYVIPEWMRVDPQVIQVENWLEARRQRGFYEGGPTSEGDTRAATALPAAPAEATASNAQLVQVLSSLDQRLREVEKWPTQLEVVLDLLGLDREQQKLKQVKSKGSLK